MTRQREAVLDDFRDAVKEYPHLVWHHCLHSTMCEGTPGLADLIIIGPGGILFRECKPHPGAHPSPAQTAWKYAVLGAGGNWAVWTPADVASGAVEADLRRAAAAGTWAAGTIIETTAGDPAPELGAPPPPPDHMPGAGAFSLHGLPDYVAGSDAWWARRVEFDRRMANVPQACDRELEIHVAVPDSDRCQCGAWPI